MPAIICPHCGVTNRAYSNFCNNCGADLRSLPADASSQLDDVPNEAPATEQGSQLQQDQEPTEVSNEAPEVKDTVGTEDDAQAAPPAQDSDVSDDLSASKVIPDLQGALEPHTVAQFIVEDVVDGNVSQEEDASARETALESHRQRSSLSAAQLEDLRATMLEDPQLENSFISLDDDLNRETLRLPLLFALILITLTAVISLRLNFQTDIVLEPLPGVIESFELMNETRARPNVLALWSYGPAMAGEMDLVTAPILRHIFDKEAQLAVVSTLPTGPATARRLWRQLSATYPTTNRTSLIDLGFLPGGSAAMPLMAYTDVSELLRNGLREYGAGSSFAHFWQQKPDLMLVISGQAEDVQLWLEQVQPLNGVPTIAVTSAGAGPILRPYWNSRQLQGLVTGFDGGIAYEILRESGELELRTSQSAVGLARASSANLHLLAQNWGHLILLALLILGSISVLVRR